MSRNTIIYLIRHGETEWNAGRERYCGKTDIPLSLKGREQAQRLARHLQSINLDCVYASPLQRALETAQVIAGIRSLNVQTLDGLREMNFGVWEGLEREEIASRYRKVYRLWKEQPSRAIIQQGETCQEVLNRFQKAITAIVSENEGKTIAVVAHRTTNRLFLAAALGAPLDHFRQIEQDNTAVNLLVYKQERGRRPEFVINTLNDTCHLHIF